MNKTKSFVTSIFSALFLLIFFQGCVSSSKEVKITFLCNALGEKPTDKLPEDLKSIIVKLNSTKCDEEELFVTPRLLTFKPSEILFTLEPPKSSQEKFFGTSSTSKLQEYIDTVTIGTTFTADSKLDINAVKKLEKSYDLIVVLNKQSAKIQFNGKSINSTNNIDTLISQIKLSGLLCNDEKKILIYYNIFEEKQVDSTSSEGIYLRDTCDYIKHISYKLVTDGQGGVKFGDKIKDSSIECGYVPPTVAPPPVTPPVDNKKVIHPQQPVKRRRTNNSKDKNDVDPFKLRDPNKPQQIDKKLLKPNQKN